MEAASVGSGDKNHLKNVLSESELANLSEPVSNKINAYIEDKFEEYLTSKALHETSKSNIDEKIADSDGKLLELTAKYEEASRKLATADEAVTDLSKQVEVLNQELEKSRDKICRLENETVSIKSARDAAVDERNDLTRILQRRDAELERLAAGEAALAQQLRSAIDAKCEALAKNDEIQSKELSLEYREKRIEQERTLLNSQIAGLTEEVNRLTSELQTVRLNNTSRLVNLETQLAEKTEELNSANETISQLNDLKKNLNNRAENLSQRLLEQREIENKMTENYKKELEAKTKLSDLFKTMLDDSESKTNEMAEGISELQKLLNEATEKYGDLETKYKQAEMDHEELLDKKNEVIASLKNEIEHANDLLKAANAHSLDIALSDLAPTAATASKLLKSGMSLTQVYSQLVKVSDELTQEKEENRRLNVTINTIIQEVEEKAPVLAKQRAEYEEAMETNSALTQQIDTLIMEVNRLRDDYSETAKISNHYNRENSRLKGELADLGRQVCFLLKEIDQSRGNPMPNGDHDSRAASNTTSSDHSSHNLSKTLVTFTDIQELQNNNQKLLRMVRDLTEKQEELERHKDEFESGDLQGKVEALKGRVTELTEAQERQTKMVNGLIRQRDMFKKLYHDLMKGKRPDASGIDTSDGDHSEMSSMDTSADKSMKQATSDPSALEVQLKETVKQFEMLKEEYKTYKEEKITNERLLFDQIDNMRQEISKLTAANSKCSSTSEYNNERLKILQTNITTYKKQISSLEDKNKAYSATIAKHEVSLQHLRDECLNAQSKLSASEIAAENLKLELKLVKDTEVRLQTEKEVLSRERQGQSLLLQNLELIKASLERVETENRAKVESRLDEATRECAALRRRLQEEQDRFRELAAHLERQTDTAKTRMQEEKDAADGLRAEVAQLRHDLMEKNKSNEDLAKKLKVALAPNTDGSLDTIKKIKQLENKLSDKENEIKALQEQVTVAKEHIKQYCDISECAEKELKNLSAEYSAYKAEAEPKIAEYTQRLQALEEKCSELEAELSIQGNSGPVSSKNEINAMKENLQSALASLQQSTAELQQAREDAEKYSQVATAAEEKYAHEMVLHSNDIQALSQVKADLSKAQNEINELVSLKNSALEKLDNEKSSWADREKRMSEENEQLMQRLKDLNDQNSLLHDQIQALGTQLSVSHASKSMSESMSESANESHMNVSVNEDEHASSEQLMQIVKFIRKEKDIAMAKFDILQAETMRLKSQLEITEKKLDDTKLALAAERDKSEVNLVTLNRQSELLRKVETLNALTDSNRILREERDTLTARVEELTKYIKGVEDRLDPLQEKISEFKARNETLQSENTALKTDSARWRTRVNALVERANKTSPEDWKRLQNERETLAKMLTGEKEVAKKAHEELAAARIEKSKIEEQYSQLSRQHSAVVEENKRLADELSTIRSDMSRLTEELAKIKTEFAANSERLTKLTDELAAKEESLSDIRNKEMQIRKIARKYKTQYEELVKSVEDDKKKTEGEAATADAQTAEAASQAQAQLSALQAQLDAEREAAEKMRQELETLRTANNDKEEKAKQVLKQAKTKIVQLTEAKNSLSRELGESRTKIEAIEQSARDEQDVRLAVIKSQFEGRIARLEKEKAEALERARELDALQQRLALVTRQLAAGKQPAPADKAPDPPTANIKPMAGVPQQPTSARRSDTPLASIRPMAAVGPTAPHEAHVTEYMPASSSRPLRTPAPPPESTQDMDTHEAGGAGPGDAAQSSSHAQAPAQTCGQVALVLPRVEPPASASASSSQPSTSAPPPAASSQPGADARSADAAAGVSTSHAPPRPHKRARPSPRPHPAKRSRVQNFERSVEVEYQVPTSSRCEDDEGVIVVDSEEDDERCCGTLYQEGEEEDEDMEEDEAAEEEAEDADEGEDADDADEADDGDDADDAGAGAADPPRESGAASPAPGVPEPAAAAPAPPGPQIEAISSGTEPSGALSLAHGDSGDDSIVPSTPTLYVPRRSDGFGEAVASPTDGAGSNARFTFSEHHAAAHLDTLPDLAPALPPPAAPAPPGPPGAEEAEAERGDEETPAVSSQGSRPSSPRQQPAGAEEGREAEASSPARRPAPRWTSPADSESGARGRGGRPRGRPPRRAHYSRF